MAGFLGAVCGVATSVGCESHRAADDDASGAKVIVSTNAAGHFVIRREAAALIIYQCPGVMPQERIDARSENLGIVCPRSADVPLAAALATLKKRFTLDEILEDAKRYLGYDNPRAAMAALRGRLEDLNDTIAQMPSEGDLGTFVAELQAEKQKVEAELARWESGEALVASELTALHEPAESISKIAERIAFAILRPETLVLPSRINGQVSVLYEAFADAFYLNVKYSPLRIPAPLGLDRVDLIASIPGRPELLAKYGTTISLVDPVTFEVRKTINLDESGRFKIDSQGTAYIGSMNYFGSLDFGTGAITKLWTRDDPTFERDYDYVVSPSQKQVVLRSTKINGDHTEITVRDLVTKSIVHRERFPDCMISAMDVSPSGEDLLVGCESGKLLKYNLPARQLLRTTQAHACRINALRVFPGFGSRTAREEVVFTGVKADAIPGTECKAEPVKVWGTSDLNARLTLDTVDLVTLFTVSPDNEKILVGYQNKPMAVLHGNGVLERELHAYNPSSVAFFASDVYALARESRFEPAFYVFRSSSVSPERFERTHEGNGVDRAASLTRLFQVSSRTSSSDLTADATGRVALWSLYEPTLHPRATGRVCADGESLDRLDRTSFAALSYQTVLAAHCGRTLRLWQVVDGQAVVAPLRTFPIDSGKAVVDGERLIVGGPYETAVWSLTTGELLAKAPVAGGGGGAAITADQTALLQWTFNGVVTQHDLATLAVVKTVRLHEGGPLTVSSGRLVAGGTVLALRLRQGVVLLNATTLDLLTPRERPFVGADDADVSEDGKWIAYVRNGKLSLWDVQNDKAVGDFATVHAVAGRVSFAPDASAVATVDAGRLTLWDPTSLLKVQELEVAVDRLQASVNGLVLPLEALTGGRIKTVGSDGRFRTFSNR